jgi:hypothetical protein
MLLDLDYHRNNSNGGKDVLMFADYFQEPVPALM